MTRILKTTSDVIDAIGGTKGACTLLDVTEQAVSVWRRQNTFPAHTFTTIQEALLGVGMSATTTLWRFERRKKATR